MKLTLKTPALAVAVGLVLAACAVSGGRARGEDAKGDLAKLKGTWVRVLDGKTYIVHFNGDKFATIFEFPDGTATASGTITTDPAAKVKHMDWKFTAGTGRAEKMKGATAQTIYEVDGDTFKFCASHKKVRPEAFPDKEGIGECLYLVLKRVK
jgi:uncharacterized protein (TIGR03067 family)